MRRSMLRPGVSVLAVLAVVMASLLVSPAPSHAEVTSVRGEAVGYQATNISLFGGAQDDTGPTPTVELASDASDSPRSAADPYGLVEYGPATIFTSDQASVSAEGSLGEGGAVTSSSSIDDINQATHSEVADNTGSEIFTADSVTGTCTASGTQTSGSTTVTNGTLATHAQAEDHGEGAVSVPTSPAPNQKVEGHLHVNGAVDNFVVVFNEQTTNPDGSITVTAVHEYFGATLDGQGKIVDDPDSTLQGDLHVGQVTCGVTASTTPPTSPSRTTAPPDTTAGSNSNDSDDGAPAAKSSSWDTSTEQATGSQRSAGATSDDDNSDRVRSAGTGTTRSNTTARRVAASNGDTSTAGSADGNGAGGSGATELVGSAYGYFSEVSLFGGPAEQRGPEPVVELAPDASNSPQDAQVGSAQAVYGPATLLASQGIEVHTEGSAGQDWSVSSSARVQGPGEGQQNDPIHFGSMESSCTADAGGTSGETTITGGQVVAISGTEPIPTNPEPNYEVTGRVPNVEDNFRIVFNEQTTENGTITVNAAHMYLEGPTAVGELVIGQSVCGSGGGTGDGGGGDADTTGQAGSTNGGADQLASTGTDPRPLTALSAVLMILGLAMIRGARRRSAAPGLDGTGR